MENLKAIKTYNDMKAAFSNKFDVSEYKIINFGIQFRIYKGSWSGLIRIYENKKGTIKIDYSQLKGDGELALVRHLIEGKEVSVPSSESPRSVISTDEAAIGTDESGKGDYFGPLVSAGVFVDNNSSSELIKIGVRDSKKNSDQKNTELADKIMEICKGKFSVIEIPPEKYNDLYAQFVREGKNLNSLLAWGHAKAIEQILTTVECKVAIADKFADEKLILEKLQERGKRIKLIQMHKAEQNIAVAAASILSRARFLEKLQRLSVEYKMKFPKGSSSSLVIETAKKFCEAYGRDNLKKVAKIHFKITHKV